MKRPVDLKYASSHEWVRLEGDVATVGITDFAVEQLGDLAFVDLPDTGAQVTRGDAFGEIESTKAASELFAPVSGEIIEVHSALAEELHHISDSPFDGGWMLRIRVSQPDELDNLMSAVDYEEHLREKES
jgi:glycine cleavage system H protein